MERLFFAACAAMAFMMVAGLVVFRISKPNLLVSPKLEERAAKMRATRHAVEPAPKPDQ